MASAAVSKKTDGDAGGDNIVVANAKCVFRYYWGSILSYRDNPVQIKFEILSGLTIAILKVPESVAFSFVAGVHPLQGLYGTFFLGLVCSLIGGRPGMVSGCAGALAVVVRVIMTDDGPFGDRCLSDRREFVLFTMFICGILQVICGLLRLAEGAKLISQSAFLGFFNALAIVIGSSQLETFRKPKLTTVGTGVLETHGTATGCQQVNFGSSGRSEWYTFKDEELWLMVGHILLVMAVIQFLPMIPAIGIGKCKIKPANILPPCLVGILLSMVMEWCFYRPVLGMQTTLVMDVSPIKGDLPKFHVPDVPWGEWESWKRCLPIAMSLNAIGLVESILTLQAVDEILDETTPSWMKHLECVAQGIGNSVSGMFSALGGDAMIGQSTVNALNGAKGRLSSITADFSVLFFVVLASPCIEVMPLAGLAGILVIVVIHCFQWHSLVLIFKRKIPLYESVTIILVTVLAVMFNLAIGVGVGVIWESLCRIWLSSSKLHVMDVKSEKDSNERKTYVMEGSVFFANAPDFCKLFDIPNDPPVVVADFANCEIVDYSGLFALNKVGRRYKELGKDFIVCLNEKDHAFFDKLGNGLPDIAGVVFNPPHSPRKPARFEDPPLVAARLQSRGANAPTEKNGSSEDDLEKPSAKEDPVTDPVVCVAHNTVPGQVME